MSTRIKENLEDFHSGNRIYKKLSLYIVAFTIIILFVIVIFKYKSKIINVVLKSKDYGSKLKNISITQGVSGIDVSMNVFSNDMKISIHADSFAPDQKINGSKLTNITSHMSSKKNDYSFNLKSKHGTLVDGDKIDLYPNVNIEDNNKNNAKFTHISFLFKESKIIGKNPFAFGIRDGYSYELNSNQMIYNTVENEINLIKKILIVAIDLKNQDKTILTAEYGNINIANKIITLTGNAVIKKKQYTIYSDKLIIHFYDKKPKKINANQMISSDVKFVKAIGNFKILDHENKTEVTANNADYVEKNGKVYIYGRVSIKNPDKTVNANHIVYNLNTGVFNINPINTEDNEFFPKDVISMKKPIKIIFD